ncbi:hypothetical protein B0H14DRAFT_3716986, partial [Mycena olivaceomarginata]
LLSHSRTWAFADASQSKNAIQRVSETINQLIEVQNHRLQFPPRHLRPLHPIATVRTGPVPSSDGNSDDQWETHLYTEDGLKSVPDSDIDSEMEPEGEDDYSLESIYLDDEVLLENLLTQEENVGDCNPEFAAKTIALYNRVILGHAAGLAPTTRAVAAGPAPALTYLERLQAAREAAASG